jgi:hypothetical protein
MNEENIRKCSVIGPCLVMREVLTYQWECWFTPKALGEGWTRGTKWGRFCGGHGRKNYSLYSKWKLEPPRGHDWRSFLSSPLLFRLPPTTTTAAVIVQCSETGKLFGLTICVCVCERELPAIGQTWGHSCVLYQVSSRFTSFLLLVTRAVSHYGLTIYMKKLSILRQKKKNYGNSNISCCKNVIFKKSSKRNENASRYYNSVTNLKFRHKPKYHLSIILV